MKRPDEHDETGDAPLTAEAVAARDAVRALGAPTADPAFRARLREAFVTGEFAAVAAPERVERSDASGERHARPTRIAPRPARGHRNRWAAVAAIAACMFLAVGIANRGPQWEVVAAGANPTVDVDGRAVDCGDLSSVQDALRPGCTIAVPDGGRLELAAAGVLALELGGGVEVTLPDVPGRWFDREIRSTVHGAGTLRVVTGPGFPGARYSIETSSMTLEVVGTAFAVMHTETSVCLCVLEGEVRVTRHDGGQESVSGGSRVLVALDGTIDHGPMHESEREALTALRARSMGRAGGA